MLRFTDGFYIGVIAETKGDLSNMLIKVNDCCKEYNIKLIQTNL